MDEGILERYHATPGQTPRMMQPWKDAHGRSSYEALVEHVRATSRGGALLDVCCGDGFLLAKFAAHDFTGLSGLDQSPHELEMARQRLGPTAALHRGDARDMPFEADRFDIVVSHMALMLVAPVHEAFAEIARVAKPGALVAIMIPRAIEDDAYEAFHYYLYRSTIKAGLQRLKIGDPRMFDVDDLKALLGRPLFDPDSLVITDSEIAVRAPAPELWSYLCPMYDVYRLPEAAKARVERLTLKYWANLADDDAMVRCRQGTRLLSVRTLARE